MALKMVQWIIWICSGVAQANNLECPHSSSLIFLVWNFHEESYEIINICPIPQWWKCSVLIIFRFAYPFAFPFPYNWQEIMDSIKLSRNQCIMLSQPFSPENVCMHVFKQFVKQSISWDDSVQRLKFLPQNNSWEYKINLKTSCYNVVFLKLFFSKDSFWL